MDIGIVSSRYAKALYKFAASHQQTDETYKAMNAIHCAYMKVPRLSIILENPSMDNTSKVHLLLSASGQSSATCLKTFFEMVVRKGRVNMMPFISEAFKAEYLKEKNMIQCRLTVPTQLGDSTIGRIKSIVEKNTKKTVEFTLSVDPTIIGGFILEYDAKCLDASATGRLRAIRKKIV